MICGGLMDDGSLPSYTKHEGALQDHNVIIHIACHDFVAAFLLHLLSIRLDYALRLVTH